jgi:signal transduction protein with GAF and PtsI domain
MRESPQLRQTAKDLQLAENDADEWQLEIKRMHEAHKATARKGHEDVMELDQGSSELQEKELSLTVAVAEGDEELAAMEEAIARFKARICAMDDAPDVEYFQIKHVTSDFLTVCSDGNRPLKTDSFTRLCAALNLSDADIAAVKWVQTHGAYF